MIAVGQALRATPVKDFYTKHSSFFKRLQEVRIAYDSFKKLVFALLSSFISYRLASSPFRRLFSLVLCGMHFVMPSRKVSAWI